MKIAIAQTRPLRGDIPANILAHQTLIALALSHGADTIIFPELSLTGYEPELARELAADPDDSRFNLFQEISNTRQISIGAGVPTKSERGTCISMILFQPGKPRHTYSKRYLHADEEAFFVPGDKPGCFIGDAAHIALAICYELSVPEHAANASRGGAQMYIASVAKTVTGVEKAANTLSGIARNYSMTVLMSNCIGPSGDGECAGKSAAWNSEGLLLGQLDDHHQGILVLDTDTQDLVQKVLN